MVREYYRPTSIAEAVAHLAEGGPAAAFLAGGTWVDVNDLRAEPEVLVDLAGLGLDRIALDGDEVSIGPCCTLQHLIDSPDVPAPLQDAALNVVNRHIRNVATVGGQLGANESNGDLLPALIALQATVTVVAEDSTTELAVHDYLARPLPGLITEVRMPLITADRGVGVRCFTHTVNDKSVVTAAVSLTLEGGVARDPIVAVGGVAAHAKRLAAVEAALAGATPFEADLAALVEAQLSPQSDHRGSGDFRKHLAGVLVDQAAQTAWTKAH